MAKVSPIIIEFDPSEVSASDIAMLIEALSAVSLAFGFRLVRDPEVGAEVVEVKSI